MTRLDGTQMLAAYQESLSTNHGWEEDKSWWMSYYKGKKKKKRSAVPLSHKFAEYNHFRCLEEGHCEL